MGEAERLLGSMRQHALDWRLEDLQTVAREHGIDWRHGSGSHCVFLRKDGRILPVPARRPIKPVYIWKFVAFVEGA